MVLFNFHSLCSRSIVCGGAVVDGGLEGSRGDPGLRESSQGKGRYSERRELRMWQTGQRCILIGKLQSLSRQ